MKGKSVTKKKNAPLPCPFCGTKPKITEGWGAPAGVGVVWTITISCRSKKRCAIKPQLSGYAVRSTIAANYSLRGEVIGVWNKRKV
jgi:hypothetical protein